MHKQTFLINSNANSVIMASIINHTLWLPAMAQNLICNFIRHADKVNASFWTKDVSINVRHSQFLVDCLLIDGL